VKRHEANIVKPTRQPILWKLPGGQFQRYPSTVISATNVARLLELLGIRLSRQVRLHPDVRSGGHSRRCNQRIHHSRFRYAPKTDFDSAIACSILPHWHRIRVQPDQISRPQTSPGISVRHFGS